MSCGTSCIHRFPVTRTNFTYVKAAEEGPMQKVKVKSATRVIEVLEYFRVAQQPRSMSQIAGDLGYPQSSTTVLLKTIVTLGYLNFDRRDRVYFPTPKVTALGEWIPRALFGNGRVIEALNDVHAATGEGVFLGTKNDVYLQYVKTRISLHALRFHIDEGTIRPITRSAAGLLLLSALPDDKIDNIVRRANIVIPTGSERMTTADVMKQLREIRSQGYAQAEDMPLKGGATLAVLLPALVQGQSVVLALGGIAERVKANFKPYIGALRAAAETVRLEREFETPVHIDL
jgi:DNA-binding IclR family transcriptional regulator